MKVGRGPVKPKPPVTPKGAQAPERANRRVAKGSPRPRSDSRTDNPPTGGLPAKALRVGVPGKTYTPPVAAPGGFATGWTLEEVRAAGLTTLGNCRYDCGGLASTVAGIAAHAHGCPFWGREARDLPDSTVKKITTDVPAEIPFESWPENLPEDELPF